MAADSEPPEPPKASINTSSASVLKGLYVSDRLQVSTRSPLATLMSECKEKCTNGWTSYESSDTYAITSMDEVHQLDVSEPGINHQGRNDNETIAQIRRELRAAHEHPGIDAPTRPDIQGLVNAARVLIVHINTTSLLSSSERFEDALQMISELQNFAYHDTDHGGVQDIAQWCLRAYLQLLAQGHESSPRLLTGLGQAWLLRSQQPLARIHRLEGSSSSGTSSDRRSSIHAGGGRVNSFTSSEDARESVRQTVEADARAGTGEFVEARGSLLPATEYFQRAVAAAELQGTVDGELLSLAAEAFISLGNVSYSQHNEQYFQQAVRYLQMASRIPGYDMSPYLQSYLDDFGRLVS